MTAKIYAKDMPCATPTRGGRKRKFCSCASLSICLTRDLNQLKIDLWIFLVYYGQEGKSEGWVTLKRLLLCCCVACQVQISKIDWNSTCPIRGVLVKPLENYSFQFSARIVINFRKTYIHIATTDFIKLLSSLYLSLTPPPFSAWNASTLESPKKPQLAKVVNGLSGANGKK